MTLNSRWWSFNSCQFSSVQFNSITQGFIYIFTTAGKIQKTAGQIDPLHSICAYAHSRTAGKLTVIRGDFRWLLNKPLVTWCTMGIIYLSATPITESRIRRVHAAAFTARMEGIRREFTLWWRTLSTEYWLESKQRMKNVLWIKNNSISEV